MIFSIGDRVRIVKAEGTLLDDGDHVYTRADPHPEHVEKLGTIIAIRKTGGLKGSPKILLDDGTIIWGYECWWTPA